MDEVKTSKIVKEVFKDYNSNSFVLNAARVIGIDLYKKKSVGTVRIIVTEGLDSLHTDKTTPHAKPEYIRKVNIWQA